MLHGRRGLARVRPRAAFLILFLVLLAACQTRLPFQTSRAGSAHSTALAEADALFFSGHYDAASAKYQKLMAAHYRDAAAHYSLLLSYENQFSAAVAVGQAAVDQYPDSAALARLTRAFDWSDNFPAALATGAEAVATQPVDPLAHTFYAEVLSDVGDFQDARLQLQAAGRAPYSPYLKSEIDREWANYYRDGGNVSEEKKYFEASYKAEPAFPERTLELARFAYSADGSDPAGARSILDRLEHRYSHQYSVLVSAAQVALVAPDDPMATSLYSSALQAQPNGAEAALGLAELKVAQSRDYRAAHDVLLAAYRAHPSAADVYLYLRYLDQLVLHRNPSSDLGPEPASATADVSRDEAAALAAVNSYRATEGLRPLSADPALEEGALSHSYYFLFNYGNSSESGLGIHSETAGLPGFTGTNGLLRARHFGYPGLRGAEVIAPEYTPQTAIQVWVDSVYHRYPILDPETEALGYGQANVGPLSINVMDMGMAQPGSAPAVVYPYPGQQSVTPFFLDNELPNPLPANVSPPVGYPVTLEVGGADQLQVTRSQLIGPSGVVPTYVLNPGTKDLLRSEWALLPQQPLQPGQSYTVMVGGRLNGASFGKQWSFRAAGVSGIVA